MYNYYTHIVAEPDFVCCKCDAVKYFIGEFVNYLFILKEYISLTAVDGKYKFETVLPGEYKVIIDPTVEWCWENPELPLTVSSTQVEGPVFKQAGVAITIDSSHATKVSKFVYFIY